MEIAALGATPNGSYYVERHYDGATNGIGRFSYDIAWNYRWEKPTDNAAHHYNLISSYDPLGRPLSQTQNFYVIEGGTGQWKPYSLSRTYDLAGGVKTQTYPSGRTVNYSYDAAGRLNEFKGRLGGTPSDLFYAKDMRYNPRGQMIREEWGTNTALFLRQHYNQRGQLFDVRLGTSSDTGLDVEDPLVWRWANGGWNRGALRMYNSTNLNDYDSANPVQGDNNGNIQRAEHFVPNALDGSGNITSWVMGTDNYLYDELNRLTRVSETPTGGSGPGFVQAYSYDRWGNRRIDVNATSNITGITRIDFQVHTATNRLRAPSDTGASNDKMRYDASGNLVWDEYSNPSNAARDFGDDANNHLTLVKNASGVEHNCGSLTEVDRVYKLPLTPFAQLYFEVI